MSKEGYTPSFKDVIRGAAIASVVAGGVGCAKEARNPHPTVDASQMVPGTITDYSDRMVPIATKPKSGPVEIIPTPDPYPSRTPEAPEDPFVRERFELPEFISGFSVLKYGNEVYNGNFSEASNELLGRLESLGVNSVSFAFPIYQENYRANSVHPGEGTPTIDNMRRFIRTAKMHGMSVMMRPILDEQSIVVDGRWRGTIEPDDREEWFASYKELVLEYAKLAESEYVEILNIGGELVSLEGETEKWNDIISSVREVFKGKVTYSFNHDSFDANGYTPGYGMIEKLDFIGMDAYYPLDLDKGATPKQVSEAFQYAFDRMKGLEEMYGVPVLIAEMGTTGKRFDRPWSWDGSGWNEQDIRDQAAYYAGFCMDKNRVEGTLAGTYFWAAYLGEDFLNMDPNTPSFSPFNKPAEVEIDKCYD